MCTEEQIVHPIVSNYMKLQKQLKHVFSDLVSFGCSVTTIHLIGRVHKYSLRVVSNIKVESAEV